jgi:transcriptional regulator with PAS, ATPase and Fis domain
MLPLFRALRVSDNYSLLSTISQALSDARQTPIEPYLASMLAVCSTVCANFGSTALQAVESELETLDNVELQVRAHSEGQVTTDLATARTWREAAVYASMAHTVLIQGETGTGKEHIARILHGLREGPFIAVNCGAIPENLIESELFGYVKGAFTGAIASRGGAFEAAARGTLFLDEVGDLPLAAQVKLLRALEQREVTRVGSTTPIPTTCRVVAATHKALVESIAFRSDLYYRLAVLLLTTTPLRDRPGDVAVIAQQIAAEFGAVITPAAMVDLQRQAWHGNVRELRNAVTRAAAKAVVAGHAGRIEADDVHSFDNQYAMMAPCTTAQAAARLISLLT